jgi:hyaluronoglucosaminidase
MSLSARISARSLCLAATAAVGLMSFPAAAQVAALPAVFPAPVSMQLQGDPIALGKNVVLVAAADVAPETIALVRDILTGAGVERITRRTSLPKRLEMPHILLGTATMPAIRAALARSGTTADARPEGYTLVSTHLDQGLVTLAGADADGLYHAAQTLRQLVRGGSIASVVVQDHPAMAIRGTIEGFYGAPWTMTDRLRHLDFLASVKANTMVYSPKDDPFARDHWRDPYPAARLADIGTLAARARQDHINFVYAISPGPTVCFSDPADQQTLERKFQALRSVGVHAFYVAFDDIEYKKWNCDRDQAAFGPSGAEAAGTAQAKLLNAVQAHLRAVDPKAPALIMVPTEYYDAKESPYKAALRRYLDPQIVVQWTGTDVVPPSISIGDARAAEKAFGRKTLLWDNYPVNDYATTKGRLLLAPYVRREAGLSGELAGILSNPMNQEAPSRVAVTGVAAFGWNDRDYDAARTWRYAARELAGGDDRTTQALLQFFDTQHLAPTFGSQPWQEQAPVLKAMLDRVRDALAGGDAAAREDALAALRIAADDFARAPDLIHAGVVDPGFVAQSRPWLDAMQLWGRALQLTAAGLEAANRQAPAAAGDFAEAHALAAQAAALQTIKGATRFDGAIRIADGVLDRFIADAPGLLRTAAPTIKSGS